MNKNYPQSSNGFALILALLVSSVALAIGLSLLDITVKQLTLSTTVRESEVAFQAAAAGINCLQTARNRYVYETQDDGGDGVANMECLNQQITMTDTNGDPHVHEFMTKIDWTTPSGAILCIEMELMVLNGAKPTPAINVAESASNGAVKSCDATDVCSFAFSRGYNRSCSEITSGALFSVQRELTAEF